MPGARPPEDDLVFSVGSLDAMDELEEHRLRERREAPAHREGHADGTEAEGIHGAESDHLGLVIDVSLDVPRVGDDDRVAPVCADEGRFDFSQAVRHMDGPALRVELRRVWQGSEHEAGVAVSRWDGDEESS